MPLSLNNSASSLLFINVIRTRYRNVLSLKGACGGYFSIDWTDGDSGLSSLVNKCRLVGEYHKKLMVVEFIKNDFKNKLASQG